VLQAREGGSAENDSMQELLPAKGVAVTGLAGQDLGKVARMDNANWD
jgi:hypothetical protein